VRGPGVRSATSGTCAQPLPENRERPKKGKAIPKPERQMARVRIEVRLKKGVADPEGDNVRKALVLLGFKAVRGVRSSKLFQIDVGPKDPKAARREAEEMCRRLLANPVIHDYEITIEK